ncbi:hypothetical protein HBI56_215390 [Parastagonospora nodorum]|nr:hypothetical protein HBI10_199740 [Parastagonospora nodorum]KAH4012228.1 hypothetical protein HBI13_190410 [Parastagonospora nodorum]KAH4043436.1 hypothetical protein HBH49_234120 [Parastagonospora nodorum]KAH4061799.1 hypothetical protein HBH50_215480 [Parastagonospora nodorum]KAH4080931.1 hypothetical protein HBH48_203510 [Parastagonospora nodorum]
MDDRHHEVLAVAIGFLVLTWATVSMRCYVRGVMTNTWGLDDFCMIASLLVFTVYIACQITAAVHGTGRHRDTLSDQDARTALMFWYLCELLYVISNCLLKFSVGYFYLRVAVQRWHIWCIRLLMLGTILFGLIYFFLVMLQCLPINTFWNVHPASAKCLPEGPTLGITYALAAVNAAADWAFGTLPIFIVWDLKMKLKTKFLVAGVLAFAAIGSVGTIVRMFYLHTLMNGPDFLYATTDVALWSTIEPGIGIAAGSIACLRPLARLWLWHLGLAEAPHDRRSRSYYQSNSDQKRKDRRGYRRSSSPSDLVPTEAVGTTSFEIFGTRKGPETRDLSLPEITITAPEPELTPSGQIRQTVTVEQDYESAPRLQLRESFRHSFTRGTILSLGKFRVPVTPAPAQQDHQASQ